MHKVAPSSPSLGSDMRHAPQGSPATAALAAPRGPRASRSPSPAQSPIDKREREAERRRLAADRAAAVLRADGLLRLPEVLALVPVSPSTWWQGIREGRFPSGVKLGARCTAWRASDVRELLARLGAEAGQ